MLFSGCLWVLYFVTVIQGCTKSPTTVVGTHAQRIVPLGQQLCSGDLIFEDNFDDFDLSVWQHEITLTGGGSWEFQYYVNNRSNSFAKNGNLHIRPTLLADEYGEEFLSSGTISIYGSSLADQCTNALRDGCSRTGNETNYLNPIKSARIRTVESFSFKYGVAEVRARVPSGDWLFPAIWFLPRFQQYSKWPTSGEIDLMESRGNKNYTNWLGVNIGTQRVGSTLHWGPNSNCDPYVLTTFDKFNSSGFDTDFHTYKLEWTPSNISFYVDDDNIGNVTPPDGGFWELGNFNDRFENPWDAGSKMAPFDKEFYIVINLAVGGTSGYFSDFDINPGGKSWRTGETSTAYTEFWKSKDQWLPTWDMKGDASHFLIDYVRVYAL